ncbi:MAG: hypothetical protein LBI57_00100 [Helicobacteraceae bacterium]|nr:hypothetical protein [Helicobacteraceae bacterium]
MIAQRTIGNMPHKALRDPTRQIALIKRDRQTGVVASVRRCNPSSVGKLES